MAGKTSHQSPNIFEYTEYRLFLKSSYEYLKLIQPARFSYRSFAKIAGYRSPNFLKLVIEGKRNLSLKSIENFSRALKLSRDEGRFFKALVQFDQAESPEEQDLYSRKLFRFKQFKSTQPLKEAQFHYYSRWYFIPIREMVASPGFKNDPKWISEQLVPAITEKEAGEAIEELLSLGLLKQTAHGRLIQAHSVINTDDQVSSISIAQFHREMIKKGSEAIERFSSAEREVSSASVGLSEKNAHRIKILIQKFRQELLAIADEPQEIDRIYQINHQLFPLTKNLLKGIKS